MEILSPNQQTRKNNMIAFLVEQERPSSMEEMVALTAQWQQRDYQLVREAYRYNKERANDRS